MKKLTKVVIKLDEKKSGTCRFFQAGDMDLFCVEIRNDAFRHYVYDNLMNILDDNIDLAIATSRYLSLLYMYHGLKRAFLEVTLEESEEYKIYTFDFNPDDFESEGISDILQEELKESEEINELYDLFPPAILMSDEKKVFRNVLEYARTQPEGEPTILLDGEKIPDDLRAGIIEKNNGIILLTKHFDPQKWNVKEVYQWMENE